MWVDAVCKLQIRFLSSGLSIHITMSRHNNETFVRRCPDSRSLGEAPSTSGIQAQHVLLDRLQLVGLGCPIRWYVSLLMHIGVDSMADGTGRRLTAAEHWWFQVGAKCPCCHLLVYVMCVCGSSWLSHCKREVACPAVIIAPGVNILDTTVYMAPLTWICITHESLCYMTLWTYNRK